MSTMLTRCPRFICGALWAVAALAGCGEQPAPETVTVAVSIAPQAWLIDRLGGERVETITLVQPGQSPATYQPTDSQVSTVMKASAYLRTGVPFENGPWFRAISASGRLDIIDARRDIELRDIEDHHHQEADEGKDPHIWLSPRLLKIQAQTAAEALAALDPAHADEYEANLRTLIDELNELDGRIRERLDPFAGRAFLIFHPAWGYFADEYGLRQIAIEIEGKDPADEELTAIQELARSESLRVVFVQPQIAGRAARAVAEAIGGRVETLDPLSADVMSNLLMAAETIAASFESEPPDHASSGPRVR